jgi:hypothetical protein
VAIYGHLSVLALQVRNTLYIVIMHIFERGLFGGDNVSSVFGIWCCDIVTSCGLVYSYIYLQSEQSTAPHSGRLSAFMFGVIQLYVLRRCPCKMTIWITLGGQHQMAAMA